MIEQHHPPAIAAPAQDAPVLNAETLSQLRDMMSPAAVREIYAVVEDLGKRAAALQRALDARDAGEIRRLGHSIKGGCSMAGALEAVAGGRKAGGRR